jgi:exo-beta-1,3-glucanase (GH17 family)
MSNNKVVRVFTMEQQFPCGPKSSCCGPIGQSKEEVAVLKNAIEELGVAVEVYYIQNMEDVEDQPQVLKLLRTFGPGAIPIITIGDEVVCMGNSDVSEMVSAIKAKL